MKQVIFNDSLLIILTLWMIKKIIIRKQIPAPSIILNKSVVEWNHMSALGKQTVEPILYLCFSILSDIMTAGKGITNPEFMKNGHWFMSYIVIVYTNETQEFKSWMSPELAIWKLFSGEYYGLMK